MSEAFIIENPDRKLMMCLSLYYRLKMEVKLPGGPTWRNPPSKMCRALLIEAGRPDPGPRKAKVYDAFGSYLLEMGAIQRHEKL